MATTTFPEVQGGGSLMLAWQIRRKKVLVVGGGEVWVRLPTSQLWLILAHRWQQVEY
jgi:hypothetical protein